MTNQQNLTRENLELAKKRILQERNKIYPNSSIKQRHKNESYQGENRKDNSKCRLRGDRDETTNHIISKCSILA